MDIPCLAIIRDPEGAVLSKVINRPVLTMMQVLRAYIRFYGCVLPYQDKMVVAKFDEVVTDFGAVIRRVNERFGTRFEEFQHTKEDEKRCIEVIDRYYGRKGRGIAEHDVARPSEARERLKEALRSQFHDASLADLRRTAYGLYERLTSPASGSAASGLRVRSYWYYLSPWHVA
jgi:hypothetical protein